MIYMRGVQELAVDVVAGTKKQPYAVGGLVLIHFSICTVISITIASNK
jgi:hypothetical protein